MIKSSYLKRLFLILLILSNAGLLFNINAQNGWEQMASMDIAKGRLQSCVIDSLIYVFGGADNNWEVLASAQTYNTISNEWSNLSQMPIAVNESNVEVIHDTIYVCGGWRKMGNDWVTINSTMSYIPKEDTWSMKMDCPQATGTNAACVLSDTLYILGGLESPTSEDEKKARFYDPKTDSWGDVQDMIFDRGSGASAHVIEGQIYAVGGLDHTPNLLITGKLEKFDSKTNLWAELADMPIPVTDHFSVIHDQKILVFGGDSGIYTVNNSYATNIIQEYDPLTNTWRVLQGMPFKRANMTGEIVGNHIYLYGGYSNDRVASTASSEVWRFNLDSLKEFVNIPDTAFLHALIEEGVDTNGDGQISYKEAESIISLEVGFYGISDMTGIEAFVNLETLHCYFNSLTCLDVSNNLALTNLGCERNLIDSLDLSKNIALKELYCRINQLTNLNLSNNTYLQRLYCSGNQIESLDLSNNLALTHLVCGASGLIPGVFADPIPLFNLVISANTALLNINISQMTSLHEVCVWEMPFPPSGLEIDTSGSPNVYFTTECGEETDIEESSQSELSIYPNPTNSLLSIETEYPDHYSININTLNGQKVLVGEMEGTSHQIDISFLESGIYFITIRSKDFLTKRKIIKL